MIKSTWFGFFLGASVWFLFEFFNQQTTISELKHSLYGCNLDKSTWRKVVEEFIYKDDY